MHRPSNAARLSPRAASRWGGLPMDDAPAGPLNDFDRGIISRRRVLQALGGAMDAAAAESGARGGGGRAVVESFCFAIDQWNARKVEAELRKRGLTPVADNDGRGFESFHVKDPDGWDLQISNGNGLAKS